MNDADWVLEKVLDEDEIHVSGSQRIADVEGYRVVEDRVGGSENPDRTWIRVFDTTEGNERLACAEVYEGDALSENTYSGKTLLESYQETEADIAEDAELFDYSDPVSFLNSVTGDDSGDLDDLFDEKLEEAPETSRSSLY